ncbi:MAG: hypothetical protein QXS81_03675 [Candidatus Micrarchaeaceae archaeon]
MTKMLKVRCVQCGAVLNVTYANAYAVIKKHKAECDAKRKR